MDEHGARALIRLALLVGALLIVVRRQWRIQHVDDAGRAEHVRATHDRTAAVGVVVVLCTDGRSSTLPLACTPERSRTHADRALVNGTCVVAFALGLAALDGSVEARLADLLDEVRADVLLGTCELFLELALRLLLARERLFRCGRKVTVSSSRLIAQRAKRRLTIGDERRVEADLPEAQEQDENLRV